MSEIVTAGLGLTKNVFQDLGNGRSVSLSAAQEAEAGSRAGFRRRLAALYRYHGSLWRGEFLRPRDRQAGS